MAFRSATPPAESDMLCESCGYILNGLDPTWRCPECGEPIGPSVDPGARQPSAIEQEWSPRSFWATTWQVIVRKRKFFRQTLTRVENERVGWFGRWHRRLAGACFALSAGIHLAYIAETWLWVSSYRWPASQLLLLVGVTLALIPLSIWLVSGVTRLAIWMTAKESRWWGMRLPYHVLRRAMDFHAANYLPVAILALAITGGYRLLLELHVLDLADAVPYLALLSAAVVAGALWLFESFVIAMRRIRLANF